jgi:hypothetical protein
LPGVPPFLQRIFSDPENEFNSLKEGMARNTMSIFIIYDGYKVWQKAYTKFEDALEAVKISMDEVNVCAKKDRFYQLYEERPAKMVEEISRKEAEKDSIGGVMVAWNELEKIGVFIMELTY